MQRRFCCRVDEKLIQNLRAGTVVAVRNHPGLIDNILQVLPTKGLPW